MTSPNPRVRVENIYPLSPVQHGLLFHALYAPGSDVYFNQLSTTLRGPLDLDAFRRSWEALQRRHGTLRTRFVWEGIEEPVQVVRQEEALPWEVIDLRDVSSAEQPARLDAIRAGDRRRGFHLAAAPPWRVTVARLASDRWLVLFSFHHLLLDGWSMGLLCKEVFALYQDLSAQRSPRLPPAPPFSEYIRWRKQQDLVAAEHYFRNHLAGIKGPTTLSIDLFTALPTAASVARADTRAGAEVMVRVPPELTAAIRAFARRNQLTASVVFSGAWAVLLGRYSGEADVTFGMTLSGRPPELPRVEERVGIFINTLPFRIHLPAGAPLVPWLHALQAQQAELTAHAHSPLVQVQQWSGLPADLPLFETIVVYENYPLDQSLQGAAGALAIEQVDFADRTNFPLSLTVFPREEAFVLRLAFDDRRLADRAVATMGEHLVVLLRAMTGATPPMVDALPLLSQAEERALAAWEAGAALPRPSTTVHGWISDAARRHPARIAARDAAGALTYAELEARAHALAHHLRGLGVRPGARVAIAMERGTELVVALLAVMKAGAAYVPLDPAYPAQRLTFMLRDCRAALLLTQDRIADAMPELGVLTLCVDGEHARIAANPAAALEPPGDDAREDDIAYVLYTSGSTGTPKGAQVSHRAVVNYLAWCHEAYLGRGGEGALVHSSIAFDLTVTSLLAPLTAGQAVELAPQAAGIEALDPVFAPVFAPVVAQDRPYALLKLTPAHLDALRYRHGPGAKGRVRAVVIGGEALTAATARAARELFPDAAIFNEYGPTEATVGCCVHEVRDEDCREGAVPIGRPIPEVTLRVLDAAMRRVPVGVTGELYIGGVALAEGYLRREGLTAACFVPDPLAAAPARLYRTGDRVRYRPDGVLEFRGRIDGQVKLRGHRIELGEIEATLRAHPAATEVVVVVSDHQPEDRRLVAYVVKAPAFDGDPLAALRAAAAERLPDYMVPSQWVLLDAVALTTHGKIDRARLPRPEAAAAGEVVRPRDAIELRLTHIFKHLLGVERMGVTDSFFELGGHSLLAVRLMARIRAEFGRDLPLATLIQRPTVAQLGTLLRSEGGPEGWSAVVAIQPVGPGTPFFCVHPAGGNVLCYTHLAQLLGNDRPFYGLQARGLEGDLPPLGSLEEMARLYVAAIRGQQPRGPYLVGGWSFGGMAAVEIARQLEAEGEVVAGLFLIDSPSFVEGAADIDIEDHRFLSYLSRFFNEDLAIAVSPDELAPVPREDRHAYMVAWARRAQLVPADFEVADLRRILHVYEACSVAHARYRPRSLPRHVVVFRALEAQHGDPLLGWGPFAQAPLVIHDAPGDHVTIMSKANVCAFAATLREGLAAADPGSRTP